MNVEPAHIDQIRSAGDGRMVAIDADVGGVAEDLKHIDKNLRVRFAENGNPPFFAIYYESADRKTTYLVLTVQAHQTRSGTWAGLDQRVVKRIAQIGHESYDYGAELQAANKAVADRRRQQFHERVGETAELAAHALRKDLGVRYKGRAFT